MPYKKIGDYGVIGNAAPDAVARTVARYLYDRDAAGRLERDAGRVRLVHTPYDWRLNR